MNCYLDIDGVILANEATPANYAKEFLQTVLHKYPDSTYWLSTHCQGNANTPIEHIGHLFEEETVELMKKIKPTRWKTSKTEAVNFNEPFIVFEDDLYPDERNVLIKHRVLENWIMVDLQKDPNQLQKFVNSFPLPLNNF